MKTPATDTKTMAAYQQIYGKRGVDVAEQNQSRHGPQIESILQHAIDRNRPADDAPDTRDGIDLAAIIIVVWLVCFVAGILYQLLRTS